MTTCRRYIITGMNKRGSICNFIWILAAVSSRIFWVISGTVRDTYGYFEYAMIRAEEERPVLAAGLSAGYAKNLSGVLRFMGNRPEVIGGYQAILQILWLILFFVGMSLLFGRLAGLAAGSILLVSPRITTAMLEVCPENYYMLYWTAVFLILGCFHSRVREKGFQNWNRLCFLALGFYLGAICFFNGIGISLPLWLFGAMLAGIICQRLFALSQKRKGEEKGAGLRDGAKEDKKMETEEKQENYFIAGDGRKIRLIDNPLPGPKKHVKREMDFDIREFDDLPDFKARKEDFEREEAEKDDFDFEIKPGDDFDR